MKRAVNLLTSSLLLIGLWSCVPIEEAEQVPSEQAIEGQAEVKEDATAEQVADDGFDFEAEARPAEERDLVGKALTEEALQPEPAEVVMEPASEPEEVEITASNDDPFAMTQGHDGAQHVQSWGMRVVATIPQAQPPRAILELPGGGEVVVVPGTLLPETGVVVLAIGERLVKIAEVTPQGANAEVTSRELHAMY